MYSWDLDRGRRERTRSGFYMAKYMVRDEKVNAELSEAVVYTKTPRFYTE